MSWGFERGKSYNRKKDIHGQFGGQQQGGIITPAGAHVVIAITGSRGGQHGYHDRPLPDGSFEYYGAGQRGDMELKDRNRRLFEHSQDAKSLLLFEEERRSLRFVGEYVCEGIEWRDTPDADQQMRKAIVFTLRPLENINEVVEDTGASEKSLTDKELEALAIQSSTPAAGKSTRTATFNVYERSKHVRNWVLRRAKGKCEYDGVPAPFLREDGEPYLEPHHIHRVSDGGPDDPSTVIALCPNCHRRAHSGANRATFKKELLDRMKVLQPNSGEPA
ncbi:HNH endonuclease [Rhizobium tibeticum]|uniref:HNH endonuclease n=1 Tax=Rhizobium tibeticum TaxID=501024 RepID=UPI0027D803F2|nr:HNH endonuclease signature motif containing protein [Rhizobium tibeticum]